MALFVLARYERDAMMTALLFLTWGMVASFFVLLVRTGAKPMPTPESDGRWAHDVKTRRVPFQSGRLLIFNSRLSNSR